MITDNEEVIASANFVHKGVSGIIAFYLPKRKWSDGQEFACRFTIESGDLHHTNEYIGYDSMQAIILALCGAGLFMNESDEIDQSAIEWPGGTPAFPQFENAT